MRRFQKTEAGNRPGEKEKLQREPGVLAATPRVSLLELFTKADWNYP
jgi:hypothetical protein